MKAMQILCRSVAGNSLASEENSAVAKIARICAFDTKQWQGRAGDWENDAGSKHPDNFADEVTCTRRRTVSGTVRICRMAKGVPGATETHVQAVISARLLSEGPTPGWGTTAEL